MAEDVDVSDVESAEKAKILNALRAERKARQTAERVLKELNGNAPLGAQPTAEALTAHVEALVAAEVAKRGNDAIARATTLEKELTTTKAKLSDLSIRSAVREAARAEHMTPEGIEHAITLGLASLACDEKGEPHTGDGKDVAGFIDGLKASAPFLWPVSRGAGSRGSGDAAPPDLGSNPWSREGFNLTAQSRITRESPERAMQLQAQAAAMSRS